MSSFILAIDQGTTSTRAILFNEEAKLVHYHHVEITQYFPQGGWVEHDPKKSGTRPSFVAVTYLKKLLCVLPILQP